MNTNNNPCAAETAAGIRPRLWIALSVEMLVLAAIIFGSAGTMMWPAGWAFLVILFGSAIPFAGSLAKLDPALMEERLKMPIQKGQPFWDKILVSFFILSMLLWMLTPGLDAIRFGWSAMPVWLQVAGGMALLACIYLHYVIMRENSYLATAVKIQADRGQKLISTGPYAIVRHPFYGAIILFLVSVGLLLGSLWALILSVVPTALLAIRCVLEERLLAIELDGYADYMRRVRYRLIPYVW